MLQVLLALLVLLAPLEFLVPLQTRWPALIDEFAVITYAYVNVHYGQLPEGRAGLQTVQQNWKTVLEQLDQLD